ncbi:MAG: tetratricopeptide repeat protein [Thiolinea sp.]
MQAAVWEDLWLNADQQGQRACRRVIRQQPVNCSAIRTGRRLPLIRAGDYARAESLYAQATLDGLYNYGNALARQGKLAEAIAAYDQVLAQNPEHEDARYNRDLLKQQQEQQQQARGQNNQQNNQNNDQSQSVSRPV